MLFNRELAILTCSVRKNIPFESTRILFDNSISLANKRLKSNDKIQSDMVTGFPSIPDHVFCSISNRGPCIHVPWHCGHLPGLCNLSLLNVKSHLRQCAGVTTRR